MNVWQKAIENELIVAELGVAEDDVTLEHAQNMIRELIRFHIEWGGIELPDDYGYDGGDF